MEDSGDIGRRCSLTKYELERVALAYKVGECATQMEAALSSFDQAMMEFAAAFHSLAFNPIAEKLDLQPGEGIEVDMDTCVAKVVKQEEAQNEHTGA